eukprot:1157364-Pelagomonas_calceolata.AAC.7
MTRARSDHQEDKSNKKGIIHKHPVNAVGLLCPSRHAYAFACKMKTMDLTRIIFESIDVPLSEDETDQQSTNTPLPARCQTIKSRFRTNVLCLACKAAWSMQYNAMQGCMCMQAARYMMQGCKAA